MPKLRSKLYKPWQLLHPDFKYVKACATDVAATIARVRKEQEEAATANATEREQKVRTIKKPRA